ncbi:hypothetical protein EON79_04490, partial [bacterium]
MVEAFAIAEPFGPGRILADGLDQLQLYAAEVEERELGARRRMGGDYQVGTGDQEHGARSGPGPHAPGPQSRRRAILSVMQSPKLAQVAFVVSDMDAAIARWRAALGLPEPHVVETDPGSAVRMDYRGVPSDARAKLAFFDLGGVQLELIQPIGEDSAWAEGLRD